MDKKQETGVVLVASPYDWMFATGCLASLHWFMPDVKVCVLIDGDVDTSAAQRTYGIQVLEKRDIPDEWLRNNSFGWGLSKMVAVWNAPFGRYLHLDADTVVWGNVQEKVFSGEHDVVWPVAQPFRDDPRKYVGTWFFQSQEIERRWPNFPWVKYATAYACTGTYALRRGCLSLNRYQELLKAGQAHPNLFKFGEMGLLNMMVFERAHEGSLRVRQTDFQAVFPDYPIAELQQRFRFDSSGHPIVKPGDEMVLHMPDKKPLLNGECYSAPMTFFRMKYLEQSEGITGETALERLRAEDTHYHRMRARFLRREKQRKIAGLLKGDAGQWRRLLSKLRLSNSQSTGLSSV